MPKSTLAQFLNKPNRRAFSALTAVSLFSGGGLSDLGYELAGFKFVEQCEADKNRAALGKTNFPTSKWIVGKVQEKREEIVNEYRKLNGNTALDLLCLTPPCQGMSSSNPGRGKISDAGKSDERNMLLLESLPIIETLRPRIVVAENVAPLLNRVIEWNSKTTTVAQAFADGVADYQLFVGIVEMADYGIPQTRRRSILVAIRHDEPIVNRLVAKKLLPWPRPTHAQKATADRKKWVSIREWFAEMEYPKLDARTAPSDTDLPLHFVVEYDKDDRRYELIADIPPYSGKNAYSNDKCPACHKNSIPKEAAYCPHCNGVLINRPITKDKNGEWRLIKGFESSYRRAAPDQPAPTITTNTSHLGSDNKIHPWENRVLSVLECADLQTVPRFYDWTWGLNTRHSYVIRNAIGEALPTYFAYLHGTILKDLLNGRLPISKLSRSDVDGQLRTIGMISDENERKNK
jgi:DNA (cytosine-5)-methyltransferase 1